MTDSGRAVASAEARPPAAARQGTVEDAEGAILRALSRGDRQFALSLCVRSHGGSIGRLCMAMLGSQSDADEATEQTLLTAHEAFGDFRREGSLRAWLLGIARKQCLQRSERQRRERRGAPEGAAEAPSSEERVSHERAERARSALQRVRPSDRDAFLLRYCGELSFEEVAAICGIEPSTARQRVSRALLALRSARREEGRDDEP